ncbi:MAG: hypothetical protein DSY46_05320 [Hydrogenimonas sp.]|nr:MAG: hypothetical protein DSY46_05320 [Hydrogenimonas sp.]
MAEEFATFESFYVESLAIGWILSAIIAIAVGFIVFFTGGTASPIVISIGSWIGSLAGYSGIAATNYGLALIGFGSLATGGLGIAGGIAILTAALTFSTEVIIDYTLTTAINTYNYHKFVDDSKKMLTLPIPQNEDGSSEYEKIVEYLKESIDTEKPLFTESNQKVLQHALDQFKIVTDDSKERIKDYVLRSYLLFVRNRYREAKEDAQKAIELAREQKLRRTLPAFIYAVSTLYEEKFDYDQLTTNYFRYAILAEPDNAFIPLMFAIYLDRLLYRMNDNTDLNHKSLDKVKEIAMEIKDEEIKAQSLMILLMRYFIRIKIEQQKILALAESENDRIKESPKTLDILKRSLEEYKALLVSMKPILHMKVLEEAIKENNQIVIVYAKYEESTHYLEKVVQELEEFQEALHMRIEKEDSATSDIKNISKNMVLIGTGIFLLLLIVIGWRWLVSRNKMS